MNPPIPPPLWRTAGGWEAATAPKRADPGKHEVVVTSPPTPAHLLHSSLLPCSASVDFLYIPVMFSGSNSYLGGNAGRPGAQQFGSSYNTQQPGQQQQQQQLNPSPFGSIAPQPTGYGQAPMQQNYTGYPMQAQPTGFQPQQQQPQQTGYQQPQPTGYQQPQQTGFQQPQQQYGQAPQQQSFQTGAPPMPPLPQMPQQPQTLQPPPAPVQQPQPTGFSQMAASFQTTSSPAKPKGRRAEKTGPKIPNIRLSFITAQDQAKFEQLFKSAAGSDQTLSGEKSRDLLMRSSLDGNSLSQIW